MITRLTKAQEAQMPVYRDRWIAQGLSMDPGDFPLAHAAITQMYEKAGLKKPVFLYCPCPFSGAIATVVIARIFVSRAVDSAVGSAVDSAVRSAVGSAVGSAGWSYYGGALWSGYASWVNYMDEVLGVEIGIGRQYVEAARSCGYYWMLKGFCLVTDRPAHIHRDEQGRLHSANGTAVGYRMTGWGLYSWHGVRVTEQIIHRPETIEADAVMQEANTEVRRVMIERLGLDRFLTRANATPIHSDDRRALYKIAVKDDEPIVAVKVQCPSTGQIYFLRVPPQIDRCDKAVAWTFGFEKVRDYHPVVET